MACDQYGQSYVGVIKRYFLYLTACRQYHKVAHWFPWIIKNFGNIIIYNQVEELKIGRSYKIRQR
jgi:hypothetical protein